MKQHVYRRRRAKLPDDRVSDIRRGSDVEGFDGFVESLQWTAGAVHGSDIRSTVACRREMPGTEK